MFHNMSIKPEQVDQTVLAQTFGASLEGPGCPLNGAVGLIGELKTVKDKSEQNVHYSGHKCAFLRGRLQQKTLKTEKLWGSFE